MMRATYDKPHRCPKCWAVIAQAGGPDKFDACRGALDAFAEKREAAAEEAGEAA